MTYILIALMSAVAGAFIGFCLGVSIATRGDDDDGDD